MNQPTRDRTLRLLLLLVGLPCLQGCDQPIQTSLRFLQRVAAIHEIVTFKMPSTLASSGPGYTLGELEGMGRIPSGGSGYTPNPRREDRIRGEVRFPVRDIPTEVARALRRRAGSFRGCYEIQLRKFPDLEGKLTISFTVTPLGTVDAPKVKESSLDNEDLETCLLRQLIRLRFAKHETPAVYQINLEFKVADR